MLLTTLAAKISNLENFMDTIFFDIDDLQQARDCNDAVSFNDGLDELYVSLDELISEARTMQMIISERGE